MCWYTNNGERLGTYDGHNGAIFDFDCDFNTKYGLSAGADCAFGLWEICTGKLVRMIEPRNPDRCTAVRWGCGDKQFLVCTIGSRKAHVVLYNFDAERWNDEGVQNEEIQPILTIPPPSQSGFNGHTAKIAEALWGPINEFIITASEDGTIRRWNAQTGEEDSRVWFNPNTKKVPITSLGYSKDRTLLIASGKDSTARIFETQTLNQLKVFTSDKPLNCACLHPYLNLVIVGGGQDARHVTTTSAQKGKFEIQFFHTIFEEKVGEIRTGHFSPINYIAVSSDGTHFATGAEEGNVRLFKFDSDFRHKFETLEKSFVDMGVN